MVSRVAKKRRRLRGLPVQVYLSGDEHAALFELCEERGLNASELIRRWIGRAKPNGPKATTQDPRQLTIERAYR